MSLGKTKGMKISRQPSTIRLLQLKNVQYFSPLGSLTINNARCTSEIKSITVMADTTLNKKKNLFYHQTELSLRTKLEAKLSK